MRHKRIEILLLVSFCIAVFSSLIVHAADSISDICAKETKEKGEDLQKATRAAQKAFSKTHGNPSRYESDEFVSKYGRMLGLLESAKWLKNVRCRGASQGIESSIQDAEEAIKEMAEESASAMRKKGDEQNREFWEKLREFSMPR